MTLQTLLIPIIEKNICYYIPLYKETLASCETVLDIGCGNGMQAKMIKNVLPHISISGLDISDYRWQKNKDLLLTVYDGKKIPFPDNSFDASLLFFTLHHTKDPERLLSESIRVSKKYILILEEVYETYWQKQFMVFYDILINAFIFRELISQPLFEKEKGWLDLFQRLQIKHVSTKLLSRPWYYPPQRIFFLLEK